MTKRTYVMRGGRLVEKGRGVSIRVFVDPSTIEDRTRLYVPPGMALDAQGNAHQAYRTSERPQVDLGTIPPPWTLGVAFDAHGNPFPGLFRSETVGDVVVHAAVERRLFFQFWHAGNHVGALKLLDDEWAAALAHAEKAAQPAPKRRRKPK